MLTSGAGVHDPERERQLLDKLTEAAHRAELIHNLCNGSTVQS